eukprot:COSAG01_NODE_4809_length_4726_cov_9.458612_5_plen_51_part_00
MVDVVQAKRRERSALGSENKTCKIRNTNGDAMINVEDMLNVLAIFGQRCK